MSLSALLNYGILLVPYFFINCILSWGLNLQFGIAGIPNFTFITFMAVGAYVTGVTALPPAQPGTGIQYILGLGLPFPLPLLAGGAAAGLLAWCFGALTLRRLQGDQLAIVTFGLGFILYDLVGTYNQVFNGFAGIAGVPQPLNDTLHLGYNNYVKFFAGLTAVAALVCWFVVRRIDKAALGRSMRAVREDPVLAGTLGKNAYRLQTIAMVVGCVLAGIGGGLIVELVSAIDPSGWTPPETFILFAALLLGGRGNNVGAMVGVLVVPVLLFQATGLISVPPQYVVQISSLKLALVGAILILVLWFRPGGILPERKGLVHMPAVSGDAPALGS